MRSLKRLLSGEYSILPESGLGRDNLCDHCGFDDCSIRQIHARLVNNKYGATLRTVMCKAFIPVLQFRDAVGMSGEFNTFRLGLAWTKRLVPGQMVSLSGPNFAAAARVKGFDSGSFEEMSARFGVDNHMMIHAAAHDLDWNLEKIMLKSYGPKVFKSDSAVTVIHLERIS